MFVIGRHLDDCVCKLVVEQLNGYIYNIIIIKCMGLSHTIPVQQPSIR